MDGESIVTTRAWQNVAAAYAAAHRHRKRGARKRASLARHREVDRVLIVIVGKPGDCLVGALPQYSHRPIKQALIRVPGVGGVNIHLKFA